jgi:hypothetical protein
LEVAASIAKLSMLLRPCLASFMLLLETTATSCISVSDASLWLGEYGAEPLAPPFKEEREPRSPWLKENVLVEAEVVGVVLEAFFRFWWKRKSTRSTVDPSVKLYFGTLSFV